MPFSFDFQDEMAKCEAKRRRELLDRPRLEHVQNYTYIHTNIQAYARTHIYVYMCSITQGGKNTPLRSLAVDAPTAAAITLPPVLPSRRPPKSERVLGCFVKLPWENAGMFRAQTYLELQGSSC